MPRGSRNLKRDVHTCLVVEIIVAFSSLKANLRASRPRRRAVTDELLAGKVNRHRSHERTGRPDVSDDEWCRDEDEDRG